MQKKILHTMKSSIVVTLNIITAYQFHSQIMGFEVFAVCSRHVPTGTSIRIILLVSDHCIQTLSKHHTCHYSVLRGKISHSSACLSTNWKSASNFKHIYTRRNLLQLPFLYYIKVLLLLLLLLLLLFFHEFFLSLPLTQVITWV